MSEITKCPHCGADARECTWIICDQPMRAPYCYERQLAQKQSKIAALESALRGVIRVADRDTVEFNAAKDALK